MSLWQATYFEDMLERELCVIAVLPEWQAEEKTPFPAVLMVADKGCEASKLVRTYALEKELAAKGMAGLCVPGWVLEAPGARAAIAQTLPAWFEGMFPVKVESIFGQGQSAAALDALQQEEELPLKLMEKI